MSGERRRQYTSQATMVLVRRLENGHGPPPEGGRQRSRSPPPNLVRPTEDMVVWSAGTLLATTYPTLRDDQIRLLVESYRAAADGEPRVIAPLGTPNTVMEAMDLAWSNGHFLRRTYRAEDEVQGDSGRPFEEALRAHLRRQRLAGRRTARYGSMFACYPPTLPSVEYNR